MTNQEVTTIKLMPVNDIMIMAKTFAESGMFTDAKQMGQAFVKIQAGQEIGIPPFAAMSGIHIIQGKPTIGAGLIASTVKGSGKYDYKVVKLDDTICSLDFYQGLNNIGNSTFTIQDAKKALTKNIDKFPKNMLFARAISNGVKWFCPDVFSGPVYTPEEMESVTTTEDVNHVEVIADKKDYEYALLSCKTVEELKDVFTAMPKAKQTEFKSLTNELKLILIGNEEAVNV
jgi:hypothetical protein